jgi:hypothetical protein
MSHVLSDYKNRFTHYVDGKTSFMPYNPPELEWRAPLPKLESALNLTYSVPKFEEPLLRNFVETILEEVEPKIEDSDAWYIHKCSGIKQSLILSWLRESRKAMNLKATRDRISKINSTCRITDQSENTDTVENIIIEKCSFTDPYGLTQPAYRLYFNGAPWRWNPTPLFGCLDNISVIGERYNTVIVYPKQPLPHGPENAAHDILRHQLLFNDSCCLTNGPGEVLTGQSGYFEVSSFENEQDYIGVIANYAENILDESGYWMSPYESLSKLVRTLLTNTSVPFGTQISISINRPNSDRQYRYPFAEKEGLKKSKCPRLSYDVGSDNRNFTDTKTGYLIGAKTIYTGSPYRLQSVEEFKVILPTQQSESTVDPERIQLLLDPSDFINSFGLYEAMRKKILDRGFLPVGAYFRSEEHMGRVNQLTPLPLLPLEGCTKDIRRKIHPNLKNAKFANYPPPPFELNFI